MEKLNKSLNRKLNNGLNKELNPSDYEYLWTDHDVNFIFTSCYLFKEFRDTDIVLIYDWKNKGLKFFLSKKDKLKFSEFGVIFYQKHFPVWKTSVLSNIQLGKKIIQTTNNDIIKLNISSMSNDELKNKILERANLFQSLGGNYFYTEFFFLDKVEELVKSSPKKYAVVVKNLKEMGTLKFEARKILNEFYNYHKIFQPYIKEVGKRMKRNDLPWLSYTEIVDIIDGKNLPISNCISDRDHVNWVLAKANNWHIIKGREAEKIMNEFDNHFFNVSVKLIKGTIANKGIYQGRVKVVRTVFSDNINEEIKKVEKGNVLVAETTGPEMMIACQKAGAIITDEGGLTSHAAIVSRELGIPCIVGAKIATKVLKDDDLVEVNAEKGTVKIIK
ncbi:hypothetical protein J4434_05355 [Candidatus Woesearchaeota archaeon]|nr:hypothetical protein [Candidatus Woesearchaeota archaeon]